VATLQGGEVLLGENWGGRRADMWGCSPAGGVRVRAWGR